MKELPLVSVIVVNYNGKKFLKDCFDSLSNLNYPKEKLEIFMVDNGSSDDSMEFVKENYSQIKILQNDVNNYARANNLGIKSSKGEYVALLNNDTKVDPNWLIELVKVIDADKSIGAVGSKILFMDGRIQSVGHQEYPNFYWGDIGFREEDEGQYNIIEEEIASICGCSVLYLKKCLEDVGFLDEDFNLYIEDVDMAIRIKKNGKRLVYMPKSIVYHIHQGSAQGDLPLFYSERNRLLFIAKYYPEKLSSALLGRGYFTAQRDIEAQAALYDILVDIVLKLLKHHTIVVSRKALNELFIELKKISNYENSLLRDKIDELSKVIAVSRDFIKSKDEHINNLNALISERDRTIKAKDEYLFNLESTLKSKDEHINNLNALISERDEIVKAKDEHIGSLSALISERDEIVKAKDEHIVILSTEISKRDKAITDIYNSTAFRFLVRPLWAVLWKIKQAMWIRRAVEISNKDNDKKDLITYVNHSLSKNDKSDEICICTIISKNYLAYARVLTESFLQYNKGKVFVLLTDKVDGYFSPENEKFTLIEIDAIKDRIPDFNKFTFQYNIMELNTAVKPFFLEFLFEKYHFKKIVFFDPDILITHDLKDLFGLLDKFSIILTPHITRPFRDMCKPLETDILKSGIYNLGFIALLYTDTTKNLIKWWKQRLEHYCVSDVENGLFVDQRWIDLVPGFFEDIFILRDKSYNIAYWNFHYRKVYMNGSNILVDDKPVNFLHFSGVDIRDLSCVSKHQNRFRLKDIKHMKPIFELYRDRLITNGFNESNNWPCVFNYFNNGIKIPDITKRVYSQLRDNDRKRFVNPYDTSDKNSYFNWLNEGIDIRRPKITRLMHEIYKKRQDVQSIYKDISSIDREAFVRWFLISAKREYNLDDLFLAAINSKDENKVWSGFGLKFIYKIRNVLRICLKYLFRNNLNIIRKLRMKEILLYKRISDCSILFRKNISAQKRSINITKKDRRGINIFGYINAEHGLGEAVRANIKCLEAMGLDFTLINIAPTYVRQLDCSYLNFSSSRNYFHINFLHINADRLPYICLEKGKDYFDKKYNIGFWVWELADFPDEWKKSFDYCNEVWVPSNFTLDSISKKSSIPVLRIPHAVKVVNVKNIDRASLGLKDNEFTFLFIFDFLSYFQRKNPLATIEAFKQAFLPSENVRLVIKCCNSSFDPKAFASMKEVIKGLNVYIIDKYLYKDEVNALIFLCDCYVSLHRCEGFGLTMAEAMYLGKPVIATGYSGNTDFMNINNSFLVKYNLVEIQKDIGPYKKGCVWAEPDIKHAAELMRYIYKNRSLSKEIGRIASQDIRNRLNYNTVGNQIKNRIEQIYKINI